MLYLRQLVRLTSLVFGIIFISGGAHAGGGMVAVIIGGACLGVFVLCLDWKLKEEKVIEAEARCPK